MEALAQFGSVLLVGLLFIGCTTTSVDTKTVQSVESKLPKGWRMEQQKCRLWIEREQAVQALLVFPDMPAEVEDSGLTSYWFTLTPTDYISPSAYVAIKKRNADLKSQAERFCRDARIREIPHEIDKAPPWESNYLPRTEKELELVKIYKSLYSDIKELPDYYLNKQSFYFNQLLYRFDNTPEEEECRRVTKEVLNLFKEYKGTSNHRSTEDSGSGCDSVEFTD